MSGYAGWKRERRLERAKWAYLKHDPLYGAIRLATRADWWTVRRRSPGHGAESGGAA